MQITKVESQKGGRFRIYLNDEPAFCLYRADINQYGLAEGMELSEDLENEIYSAVLSKRAKLRCLHILEKADKTEYQLRSKLKEGEYPESVIDEALDYVKSFGYVDDKKYALSYISDRCASRSALQIKMELKRRGVADAVIAEAMEEQEGPDEKEQIRMWMLKRRFDPETASEDESRKFSAFLMRKGYHFSDIRSVLSEKN